MVPLYFILASNVWLSRNTGMSITTIDSGIEPATEGYTTEEWKYQVKLNIAIADS